MVHPCQGGAWEKGHAAFCYPQCRARSCPSKGPQQPPGQGPHVPPVQGPTATPSAGPTAVPSAGPPAGPSARSHSRPQGRAHSCPQFAAHNCTPQAWSTAPLYPVLPTAAPGYLVRDDRGPTHSQYLQRKHVGFHFKRCPPPCEGGKVAASQCPGLSGASAWS